MKNVELGIYKSRVVGIFTCVIIFTAERSLNNGSIKFGIIWLCILPCIDWYSDSM